MSGLFNLPPRATKAGDSLLAKKASKAAQPMGVTIKGGGGTFREFDHQCNGHRCLENIKIGYEVIE